MLLFSLGNTSQHSIITVISMNKVLFFNRSSVHYRKNIYLLMERMLNVDFLFGDSRPGGIRPIEDTLLHNRVGTLHNISIGPFYYQKGVISLLRSEYTDFITPGDTYCLSTWLFLFLAKFTHKRVFLWTHGAYGGERYLKKWIVLVRAKLADGLFLYGNYAKELLSQYGANPHKLHVVYNSLSYDEHKLIRESLMPSDVYFRHFGNNNHNLVFIGRLTSQKKLDQLILVLSLLKKDGYNYNLTLIGDGDQRGSIEKLICEKGISESVWLYGACHDEEEIGVLLYNADLCVSPGNVGLTAMHSMSFGTPVISHNNFANQMPEFEAIIEGKTGTFFKEGDVLDMETSIIRWFNSMPPRDIVRRNCYSIIDDKYNPHLQVETIKNVLGL